MGIKGYFIQYKFILPESTSHSSYTYQKLFRALYGYTQSVYKSNGKVYKYHRPGVLSKTPYIRSGKNCVIIPPGVFNHLTTFFKTGQNPAHYWKGKGDWKAVYYMDEKNLDGKDVAKALEHLIDRTYVISSSNEPQNIANELTIIASSLARGDRPDEVYSKSIRAEAESIVNNPWFSEAQGHSAKLAEFYKQYIKLKAP